MIIKVKVRKSDFLILDVLQDYSNNSFDFNNELIFEIDKDVEDLKYCVPNYSRLEMTGDEINIVHDDFLNDDENYFNITQPKFHNIRNIRNSLLQEFDWAVLPDVNLPDEKKEQCLEYRRKLRNLTTGVDNPFIIQFPEKPILKGPYVPKITGESLERRVAEWKAKFEEEQRLIQEAQEQS